MSKVPKYVPLACQIHTCPGIAVAFCDAMAVFVCTKHRDEWCIPEGHPLLGIEQALRACIVDSESNAAASKGAEAGYKAMAKIYRRHLKLLEEESAEVKPQ
jgi:hypothetical protein